MKPRSNHPGNFALLFLVISLAWPVKNLFRHPSEKVMVQSYQAAQSVPDRSTPERIRADLTAGRIDHPTASLYLAYAFFDYSKLPRQYRSRSAWEGTLPLLELQTTASAFPPGQIRRTIENLLSSACNSSVGDLTGIYHSPHFHIQYGSILAGLTLQDYINTLETAWDAQIVRFGWAAPPVLPTNPPPGDRYHVRIDTLGGGLLGYVSSTGTHAGFIGDNPSTAWDEVDAYATCMVLNNNFTGFPSSPLAALQATTAHELNHALQYGYGALFGENKPDNSLIEGSAIWMEDEVFDDANDNYHYLWPTFSMCMGNYSNSPYPYWITLRGLVERYGSGVPGGSEQVLQDFWEMTSQNLSGGLDALEFALSNQGTSLADAFHAYAIAAKFNRPCGGGYVHPNCLEEGPGYVHVAGNTLPTASISAAGGSYSGQLQDNYALNWVQLPVTAAPYQVTLETTAGNGQLRASVVCDTGMALVVHPLPELVGPNSSSTLESFTPNGCASVVMVITNQAKTASNPTTCTPQGYILMTSPIPATLTPSPTPPAATPRPTFLPLLLR